MDNETVTISKEEYDDLLDSQLMLSCLESAGVDNWDGYDYAIDEYREAKDDQ